MGAGVKSMLSVWPEVVPPSPPFTHAGYYLARLPSFSFSDPTLVEAAEIQEFRRIVEEVAVLDDCDYKEFSTT